MNAHGLALDFRTIEEPHAGGQWQALFEEFWEAYSHWFLREGDAARPTYAQSIRALRKYLPDLVPVYDRLVELAGGGDRAARFLSLYRPTPAFAGCSQLIWNGEQIALVRNYDYAPQLCDGVFLSSAWTPGYRVIAALDCLWGVLDGMNEHGLAVALAFGGRKVVGDGFAATLILRNILETCDSTASARQALARIPTHMAYNISVVDSTGSSLTAQLSPDRPASFVNQSFCTNHQIHSDWPKYVRVSRSVERASLLRQLVEEPIQQIDTLIDAFLNAPLFQMDYAKGRGTLYTTVYFPESRRVRVIWPDHEWDVGFDDFVQPTHVANYSDQSAAENVA